jgi:hypothetical protein
MMQRLAGLGKVLRDDQLLGKYAYEIDIQRQDNHPAAPGLSQVSGRLEIDVVTAFRLSQHTELVLELPDGRRVGFSIADEAGSIDVFWGPK